MHLISSPARRLAAVIALLAPLLVAVLVAAPPAARASTAPQSLPFIQNWSNAGLITADNNWDGVPGIVGYSGRDLVVGTGVNPQTVLADGSATPVDVLANQSDPAALNPSDSSPGGLVEFDGLPDRTVALGAGPDADAPHLVIHINTTGATSVGISYRLRDIDASARNTTQPVALQYRVGASGPFTNIPGGFVQDATTGPNQATRVVDVNVPLPEVIYNQPLVQLRIITTNASGDDEWVGVDDISVTAATGDAAPSVVAVAPSAGSTAPAETDISITFSEPVTATANAMTLICSGTPFPFTGLPVGAPGSTQIVLDPTGALPTGASCEVTVLASGIADVDGSPTPMVGDYRFSFNVGASLCPAGASLTRIHQVQGAGATTPLPTTQEVTIRGVVTALFSNEDSFGGFFMQEEPADQDGNPATSEGIFVATGAAGNPAGVRVGDVVQVTGRPEEFSTTGSNTQTQLSQPAVVDCGSSAPTSPVDLTLPVSALADVERYEGMLVRLPQELTIGDYGSFDRFGEYVLARPRDGETRLIQPTQAEEPGAAAQARAQENLLRRIIVDDSRTVEYPTQLTHPNGQPFTLANRFRGGDTVTGLQGILAQQFGSYRIQPTLAGAYAARNQRPNAPANVGGTLRVGALATDGYFLTLDDSTGDRCGPQQNQPCRGASSADELARQRAKMIAAVRQLDPDILGLIELENTPGVSPLADLVAGLNAAVGAGTYAFVDTGVVGSDAARVGLLYKPAKAAPVGEFRWLTAAVDSRFNATRNWPVLAQSFRELSSGERLTVAVAHLARRDTPCNAIGDPDTGDGQANCNLTRRNAAQALVDWLAADPTGSGDADVLIVGNLNSYAKEAPIDAILAGPDDNPATAADNYVDLILARQGPAAASVVADAQAGYLDHALASPALAAQVSGAAVPRLNADEPDVLDYDLDRKPAAQRALFEANAFRSSSHDPVLVGVDLGADDPDPPPPTPLPTPTPGVQVRLPLVRK